MATKVWVGAIPTKKEIGLVGLKESFMNQKFIKSLFVIPAALMLMGNQSCEQKKQPEVKKRELKKIVEMGKIYSSPINLPSGGKFDFEFVANQQIYAVLQNSESFALRYNPPINIKETTLSGERTMNLKSGDLKLMKAWGADTISEKATLSKEASCMVNLPQARLSGAVNAFELIGGGGLSIGFNQVGHHDVATMPEIGINIEWSQLDVSMAAYHPLTRGLMAAANVNAKQTKTQVSFAFNVGAFRLGPKVYFESPLAKVTENALKKAVSSLKEKLDKEDWHTRVIENYDNFVSIVGGNNINLKLGDQLNVYNEEYTWDGEPCASAFLGGWASEPAAIIEIDRVGDEVARGKVIWYGNENVRVGAKVKLLKLKEDTDQQKVDPKK